MTTSRERTIAEYDMQEVQRVLSWYDALAVRSWQECVRVLTIVLRRVVGNFWLRLLVLPVVALNVWWYLVPRGEDSCEYVAVQDEWAPIAEPVDIMGDLVADVNAAYLLVLLCYIVLVLVMGRYVLFLYAYSMGVGYADVMRLTRRGCLFVGRHNGYRLYLPWRDYVGFELEGPFLVLVRSEYEKITLPLPRLDAAALKRLKSELQGVFAAARERTAEAPCPNGEVWTGRKLVSPSRGRRTVNMPLCRDMTVATIALAALVSACLVSRGIMPWVTVLMGQLLLLLWSVMSYACYRKQWICCYRRRSMLVYSPLGGWCRIPYNLAKDVVRYKGSPLLRLENCEATLPLPGEPPAPLKDLKRVRLGVGLSWWTWGLCFVLGCYLDIMFVF